jgi:hypothetical protein
VLYGIGARLDQQPDLLFRLHNVDEKELIAGAGTALPQARKAPIAGKILGGEDLSVLFGLEMAPDTSSPKPKRQKAQAGKVAPAMPDGRGKVRVQGGASRRLKQSSASGESRGSKKK